MTLEPNVGFRGTAEVAGAFRDRVGADQTAKLANYDAREREQDFHLFVCDAVGRITGGTSVSLTIGRSL
jgi:hypothetical protein